MTRVKGSVRHRSSFAALSESFPAWAAVLVAGLALLPSCSKSGSPTLVKTGDRVLTVADFEAYARRSDVMQGYAALPESAQKQALLDDLVSYEVLAEAARKNGYDKDSAYTKIEEEMLPRILPDLLYDKKIGDAVRVSDGEAKLYYDSQKNEYQLAVIMVTDSTVMPALLARVNKGEPFEEVARSASQDPETAKNGGLLANWVTLGQLPTSIEKAIAPLKKGEHTGGLKQRNGTFAFRVVDIRPHENPTSFEQSKADILRMLESKKRGELADRYLSGLREKAHLKIEGPGWAVVEGPLLALPDTLQRWITVDPRKAGLTDEQLDQELGSWSGTKYTVRSLLKDIGAAPPIERPSIQRSDLLRQFVEGKAMSDILMTEARSEGLDKSPEVARQIQQTRTAYLVDRYIQNSIARTPAAMPTPAQLDSITQHQLNQMNQMGPDGAKARPKDIHFASLPPMVQQQIIGMWQREQQQVRLKAEVDRLKAELKPVIDQNVFRAIVWPVPEEKPGGRA